MNVKKIFSKDPDLAFAVILSVLVFSQVESQ